MDVLIFRLYIYLMLNLPRIVGTGGLFATCLPALSQDKSDYLGRSESQPCATAAPAVATTEQAAPKRVVITNNATLKAAGSDQSPQLDTGRQAALVPFISEQGVRPGA